MTTKGGMTTKVTKRSKDTKASVYGSTPNASAVAGTVRKR
jgi:hypothetical protein